MNMRSRFSSIVILAVALAALLMTGCETAPDPMDMPPDPTPADSDDQENEPDSPKPEPPPSILGEWNVLDGTLFSMAIGTPLETPAMTLHEDGTGLVVFRDPDSGLENCMQIHYALHDDILVMDYIASGIPIGRIFTFELQDDESMTAFDQDGRIAYLSRPETAFPAEQCQRLSELTRLDGFPKHASFGELEFDGTNLYYPSDEFPDPYQVRSVNAETGQLNANIEINPPFITAWQGGAFWAHCACGGSEDTTLSTPAMALDTIVTTALGHDIAAYNMAADPANGVVWIAGPADNGQHFLLKVNAAAEPDVLLDAIELDFLPQSLAFDGTHLWTLSSFIRPVVARIDLETGELIEYWQPPDAKGQWSSIAFHDGRMFLLGTDAAENGVIVEVEPPPLP